MLQAFEITFRQGLEAFLIVAIGAAYMRKSGRLHLMPAVRWGIVASILVSIVGAVAIQWVANQALGEGILALAAAGLAAAFSVPVWHSVGQAHPATERSLSGSRGRGGLLPYVGVLCFTVLMISREGIETVRLLIALVFQIRSPQVIVTACAGILLAAGLAWLWTHYGRRIDMPPFLQVTAIFLFLFVVQLAVYGFHELTEANVFPNSEPLHAASEPYGPDGKYGRYYPYLLVMVPLAWLAIQRLRRPRPSSHARPGPQAA
jgi:high-affinity iron transporter